jgi:hypothetical protein
LTLAAPASLLAAGEGASPLRALACWGLATIVFCGSSTCVNVRIRGRAGLRTAFLFHLVSIGAAVPILLALELPPLFLLPLLPGVARLLWIALDPERYRSLPLRTIGLQETALALLFLALAVIGA